MSFTTFFSIASFKFLTCSFIFLVAHLVLLNIVMFLFFGHQENYDLITQKQMLSCVAVSHNKNITTTTTNQKENPYLTRKSGHDETKSHNLSGGHSIYLNWNQNGNICLMFSGLFSISKILKWGTIKRFMLFSSIFNLGKI